MKNCQGLERNKRDPVVCGMWKANSMEAPQNSRFKTSPWEMILSL